MIHTIIKPALVLGLAFFGLIALAEATDIQIVKLTVTVKEDDGKTPIPEARVNVYQTNIVASEFLTRVPDFGDNTNTQGIVRFDVKVEKGQPLKVSIEAGREDKIGERQDVEFAAKDVPPQILRQFFLKSRALEAAAEATAVKVSVRLTDKDRDKGPIEGASILVEAVGITGRATGSTNANGETTIMAPRHHTFDITASKELFGSAKQRVTSKVAQPEMGPVQLFLERQAGTELIVTVSDDSNGSPVGDAVVRLDGPDYLRQNTSGGTARFIVIEPGTYSVRITQQYYQELTEQITVGDKQAKQTEAFFLSAKGKKEEEKDKIEVTVLAREDKESTAKPLPRAEVKVGRYTMATDENGQATHTGSYDFRQEVEVRAQGYKTQTKSVGLGKAMRYSAGQAKVTFTLEPQVSETDPVRIIVEVRDHLGKPVNRAGVGFRLPDGTRLGGGLANAKGEVEFPAKDTPAHDPTVLRKGMEVYVGQPGYLDHTSAIDQSLLLPSTQPRRYSIQLDKDWTDLTKALGQIEGRVGALRNEIRSQVTKGQSVKLLAAKSTAARGRVESRLNELKAAQKAFDTKLSGTKCEQAKELVKSIEGLQKEAAEKEKALRKLLDEALGLVAICKTKAEGAVVAEKYRNAIKLAGEMNGLAPKASLANDKLKRFAEAMKDAGPLQTKLKEIATNIDNDLTTANNEANSAMADSNAAHETQSAFAGKRAALVSEYQKLKTTHQVPPNYAALPEPLTKRLQNLDQVLGEGGESLSPAGAAVPDFSAIEKTIQPNLTQIEKAKSDATFIIYSFEQALCKVEPMDPVVQELNSLTTGNTIEISSVADLPARAQACGGGTPTPPPTPTPTPKASPTPTPTPSPSPSASPQDEMVTVPAVTGAESIDYARTILNQAGFKSAFKAIKPKEKKEELTIANTNPAAGEKAKRGSLVTVFIYQKWEPTPTPTPTPPPAPTPTPTVESVPVQPTSAVRFDGTYAGSYRGADKGAVRFTVSGGSITITSPGSGSGRVSASGSASISGAGNDGDSSYSFTGTFAVGPDGKAVASGKWSGQQSGFKGSGTWSAARP